jgi:hypothetical protein
MRLKTFHVRLVVDEKSKVWPFFGSGSTAGGTGPPTYGTGADVNVSLQTSDKRVCSCLFAPGMASGFRQCRCNTRCTQPMPIHPAQGWLAMLYDGTRFVGFKSELLPETTSVEITPKTELTRDIVITFPASTSTTQIIQPEDWRVKLFPPHRDVMNVHPFYPIMPLVIELIDYTSDSALELTIHTVNRQGLQQFWTPRHGTCIVEGARSDNWRNAEGVYLPHQPSGGVARRVLYVYDVEECSRPSIRACMTINWNALQSEIRFATRPDTAVSYISMPPTQSTKPIRDAKQLFALCVARDIQRTATTKNVEISSLVRDSDQSQEPPTIMLPQYFKTAVESRNKPGGIDDLSELIEYWKNKAAHAQRCFDATSALHIAARPIGPGGNSAKPVTLHLRFTYVTIPVMTNADPAAAQLPSAATSFM